MAQQAENLILVKLNIDAIDRLETIIVLLMKTSYFKKLFCSLFRIKLGGELFIALWIHAQSLKLHGLIHAIKLVSSCRISYADLSLVFASAAAPKAGLEAEARMGSATKSLRHYLLEVKA